MEKTGFGDAVVRSSPVRLVGVGLYLGNQLKT